MTTNIDLSQQIEQLIQDHIAEIRKTAEHAVARAFGNASHKPKKHSPRKNSGSVDGAKRSMDEILNVSKKLNLAICEFPGETMAVLAKTLGLSPKDLHLPMVKLKKSNRVKSIGQRNFTRYYPLVQDEKQIAA